MRPLSKRYEETVVKGRWNRIRTYSAIERRNLLNANATHVAKSKILNAVVYMVEEKRWLGYVI
jgi:hypothetical protein